MKRLYWLATGRYADLVAFLALLLLIVVYSIICGGCANITPQYDSAGNITGATSYGFLRTIHIEQVKSDGSKMVLETQSNTGEVLGGVNQMMGTAVGATKDILP